MSHTNCPPLKPIAVRTKGLLRCECRCGLGYMLPRHEPHPRKSVTLSAQVFRQVLSGDNVESSANVIHGLHSYDLHLNHEYRGVFGLDCVVPDRFLRGLPGHEIRPSSSGTGVPVFASPAHRAVK